MLHPLNWITHMNSKDWLDIAIAVGLIVLSIDKWVHGREQTEDRQSGDIRRMVEKNTELNTKLDRSVEELGKRIDSEIGKLWKDISDIHGKASDMSSEFQSRGGELSADMRVVMTEIKHINDQLVELFRINERRRDPPRGPRNSR